MESNPTDEKDKKNQPVEKKSGNDKFPQEYEEQRSENLRMNPQPLENPEKKVDLNHLKNKLKEIFEIILDFKKDI